MTILNSIYYDFANMTFIFNKVKQASILHYFCAPKLRPYPFILDYIVRSWVCCEETLSLEGF